MGANAQTSVPTFTAGDVLTAANMNISARTGVPVFASTVTRDAAFGGTGEKTLAEGQMCYVEGTGFQTYNGTSWVTWGTAPSTGALIYITTATVTAQTTLTVNNVFSATYKNYFMTFNDLTTAAGATIDFQFATGGTANATANYQVGSWRIAYSAGAGNSGGQAINQTKVVAGISTDGGATLSHGSGYFFNPFATANTGYAISTAGSNQTIFSNGLFSAATSFDGITISSPQAITGTFRFYGVANS